MHGLVNRAIQNFAVDTYGRRLWERACAAARAPSADFEAMLHYDDDLTDALIERLAESLGKQVSEVLEDLGTYLVSHPSMQRVRRLLRFGGEDFREFLHSLDDLPDRARLAVSDLELPQLDLVAAEGGWFDLRCQAARSGERWAHVLMGVLRAMADDYGALVFLEYRGRRDGDEVIAVSLVDVAFAEGRAFELGRGAA